MARKKGAAHGGGHGWFVTFADLMGLLMSFFVMLTAMSTQDQKKMQAMAGSMRDAFGVQRESRFAGVIESDGIPTRPNLKNIKQAPPEHPNAHGSSVSAYSHSPLRHEPLAAKRVNVSSSAQRGLGGLSQCTAAVHAPVVSSLVSSLECGSPVVASLVGVSSVAVSSVAVLFGREPPSPG